MNAPVVQVDADVLRIAYAFQDNARRPSPEGSALMTAARYILVQPATTGQSGILVFSTDGESVCVQNDPDGECAAPCTFAVVPDIRAHIAEDAHGIQAYVKLFDGKTIEARESALEIGCAVDAEKSRGRA